MNTSLFELFKIGIGPSSSHTVGPMRAALRFADELLHLIAPEQIAHVRVDLYGSLAHTGVGHATDTAVLYALSGLRPDTVTREDMQRVADRLRSQGTLVLAGLLEIPFTSSTDLLLCKDQMYPPDADPEHTHPNGLRFTASGPDGAILLRRTFYSVGGGFILSAEELAPDPLERQVRPLSVPYPFGSARELLALAKRTGRTIAEIVLHNEIALLEAEVADLALPRINRPTLPGMVATDTEAGGAPSGVTHAAPTVTGSLQAIEQSVLVLAAAMEDSMQRGIATEGILPGGLNVRRRAPRLYARIVELDKIAAAEGRPRDPLAPLDWVSLFAIAVNEENAAGGRVVTAPTNGAAGVIPSILAYYLRFIDAGRPKLEQEAGVLRFFLTAAAIGILYKENASISGAEVGCQGEVGVACSMAAGGLVAALGGTNEQVEHAAEIAMEHNLGMTCDPIGGLVQIPCIERNAMGAVKAVNACRMAMHETEGHKLSLDQVIETMYRTGMDMQSRYKETSQAGLALNIIEC